MANYKKKDIESAGRLAIKEAGGIRNLAVDVTNLAYGQYTSDYLLRASQKYAKENVLIWTKDRRAWLDRRGINYTDADATFNRIAGQGIHDEVAKYMIKHRLMHVRNGNGWKLVKYGPMIRKTTKKR